MRKFDLKFVLHIIIFAIIFAAICGSTAYGINYLISFYRLKTTINSGLAAYDSKMEGSNVSWVGPRIGETIPIKRLKTFDQSNPTEGFNDEFMMFLVINPGCPVCQGTGDQMKEIEQFAKQNSIGFFLVSFNKEVTLPYLLVFRDSAGLSSKVFSFDGVETEISPNTIGLQYPSYILTNRNGEILRIFAGSHMDDTIRKNLTAQLEEITLLEKKTLAQ
jgi:hypothetical protein